MLTDTQRHEAAEMLNAAHRTHKQVPSLKKTFPEMEIEDAYRIQEIQVEQRVAVGAKIKGYKVGLTSKVMQELAGINEPDYGFLMDDMFIAEESTIDLNKFFWPNIEIELAFVMKHSLEGPNVNAADVIRATDFVLPAIEMVEKRVVERKGVVDTIADLASCAAVVLGGNPMLLTDIDIRAIQGAVIKNGELVTEGSSKAVMGNPVNAIAWLANKLHEFGVTFNAGDVILSGSFIRVVPTAAGDHFIARFDSGFGDIHLHFKG
ncbi:MAG: fumarylacetoacetate hydrolase family protein [Chloroflexota bacterium]